MSGYQEQDERIVDYELFRLEGVPWDLRGPSPQDLAPGSYFVCLGAAQTFGRFCPQPYPSLLAERLNVSVLNLSHGGAMPRVFARNETVLEYANRSRFALIQVLAARGEANSLFETSGNVRLRRRADGAVLMARQAYEQLLEQGDLELVQRVVTETRQSWLDEFRSLLGSIRVPKLLFWFSTRSPGYQESYASVDDLFSVFPQLVNDEMIRSLRPHTDAYVECVTDRGIPQQLVDRTTGDRATYVADLSFGPRETDKNDYYPSPEMHRDAAHALADHLAPIVESRQW